MPDRMLDSERIESAINRAIARHNSASSRAASL